MDGDRKYRQNGYQNSERGGNGSFRDDRPKSNGSKFPLDVTGPKLPRLVQNVVASRCFNCAMTLAADADFHGKCPKCGSALHCCKQCVNFDSSTRFQCLKPIPIRIPLKDQENTCNFFSPMFTVARDAVPPGPTNRIAEINAGPAPRNAGDARAAFDNLFKK
jgi:hypothetical protein